MGGRGGGGWVWQARKAAERLKRCVRGEGKGAGWVHGLVAWAAWAAAAPG